MVWGALGGFEAHLVKHGPLKEGLSKQTLWEEGLLSYSLGALGGLEAHLVKHGPLKEGLPN